VKKHRAFYEKNTIITTLIHVSNNKGTDNEERELKTIREYIYLVTNYPIVWGLDTTHRKTHSQN
jgi:hypothetical protein